MFENPRRGRQAKNFTTNVPKIVDLKSSSEQIFPKIDVGCPWFSFCSDDYLLSIKFASLRERLQNRDEKNVDYFCHFCQEPINDGLLLLSILRCKYRGRVTQNLFVKFTECTLFQILNIEISNWAIKESVKKLILSVNSLLKITRRKFK